MEIKKAIEGACLTVALEGELNTITAPELEAAIYDDLENVSDVVFDMTELGYITSAGLRVLLYAEQEVEGRGGVTIKGACDEIKEILEMTGFDSILNVE